MIQLTDENSWRCEVHEPLKCRVYPKTKAELRKHYEAAKRREQEHGKGDSWRGNMTLVPKK